MLLAIDVGNTNIVLGLFDDAKLKADWRLSTHWDRTADEVGIQLLHLFEARGIDPRVVDGAVVASVVPNLNDALEAALLNYMGVHALMLEPGIRTGIRIRYDNPRDVGADRIANAVAAHQHYGGPAIVIDFGTAVTYDAVSADGEYLGGAIAPGVQISLDSLVGHTAKLPRVQLEMPENVIGRNTVASIQAGLLWGFVAQVEGMVERMRRELGGNARVLATGGQAEVVAGHTSAIDHVDQQLTLEGLRLIYEQNRESKPS